MNIIQSMVPLIGPQKEQLPQSRIKDHVDHVGLSQPQETLKDIGSLIKEHYQAFPNNN
jgi:hypothetical protein